MGCHGKKLSRLPPAFSLASELATMRPQHQLVQWPAWQKINLPKQGFLSDQLAELTHSALTDCSTQYNISRGNRWDGGSVGLPLLNSSLYSNHVTCKAKPHAEIFIEAKGTIRPSLQLFNNWALSQRKCHSLTVTMTERSAVYQLLESKDFRSAWSSWNLNLNAAQIYISTRKIWQTTSKKLISL